MLLNEELSLQDYWHPFADGNCKCQSISNIHAELLEAEVACPINLTEVKRSTLLSKAKFTLLPLTKESVFYYKFTLQ